MAREIKIATLVAEAKLDNRRYRQGLKGMKKQTDRSVGQMVKRIAGLAIAFLGVRKAIDFVKNSIIGTTANFESLGVRFGVLIGDTKEATKQFKKLVEFSTKTPFKIQEVVEAAVALESFGAESERLIPVLGDLAGFLGGNMVEAASAFGRAFAAGAGAADIFRDKGVLNIIKMQTGINDLTKLTLPEFRFAMIKALTDPDGKIFGGAALLAKTLAGKWSTFVGEVDLLWVSMGDKFQVRMKRLLDLATIAVRLIREQFADLVAGIKEDLSFNIDDSFGKKAFKVLFDELARMSTVVPKLITGGFKEALPATTSAMKKFVSSYADEVKKLGEVVIDPTPTLDDAAIRALSLQGIIDESAALQRIIDLKREAGQVTKDIDERNKERTLALKNAAADVVQSMNEHLKITNEELFESDLKSQILVDNMLNATAAASQFIRQLKLGNVTLGSMVRLALSIAQIFSPGSIGLRFVGAAASGLATGGGGVMSSSGVLKGASGLSGIVPGGFQNDAFPILVSTGERVKVETPAQANASDGINKKILGSLSALNANISRIGGQDIITAEVNVSDRDLQLLVEKSQRRDLRLRG